MRIKKTYQEFIKESSEFINYKTLKEIFANDTSSTIHTPPTIKLSDESKATTDMFVDAEDHFDNTSEEYDANDEPDVVYKKATHNAKVRMNKTLKKAEN